MSAEAIIYAILTGDSAVTDIVGSRIYAGRAPQDIARPYITYERITTRRDQAINRWLRSPDARVQIDCWADQDQYSQLVDLSDAIRKAIETVPRNFAGTIILGRTIENEQGPYWEEDGRAYRKIIEPFIQYRED